MRNPKKNNQQTRDTMAEELKKTERKEKKTKKK